MSTVAERVVEIQVEGRTLGLAREDLAGAVVRALEIKRQIKALETELDKALADVRFGVDQAGLKDRPLHLAAEGLGKVSISETQSVRIDNLKGLVEVAGMPVLDMVSARPQKEMLELLLSADSALGNKMRDFCSIERRESVSVRVKM